MNDVMYRLAVEYIGELEGGALPRPAGHWPYALCRVE